MCPFMVFHAFTPWDVEWGNDLGRMSINTEIHLTVKYRESLKSLGLDGYHVLFFQNHWREVGGFWKFIKEAFQNPLKI